MNDTVTQDSAAPVDAPASGVDDVSNDIMGVFNSSSQDEDTTTASDNTAETQADATTVDTAPAVDTNAPAAQNPASGTPEATQPQAPAQVATPDLTAIQQQLEGIAEAVKPKPQENQPSQSEDYVATLVPQYDFKVPEALQPYLNSEDPGERTAGIQHLMNGVAKSIHYQTMKQVQQIFASLHQNLPNIIGEHTQHQATTKTVFDDFYGKYPDLNSDMLKPVTLKVYEAYVKQNGVPQAWTPELRDALASKVYEVLGRAPAQPAAPTNAPKPPAMMNGSNGSAPSANTAPRAPTGKQPVNLSDEIFATFQN